MCLAVVHGLGDRVHHVPVHAAGQPEQREPAAEAARFRSSEVGKLHSPTKFSLTDVNSSDSIIQKYYSDSEMHFSGTENGVVG